jgi:dynein heavy chain
VFLDKAHQLYEMILVRHGLMLVGYSYGAKTCIYRALAGALADLEAAGLMEEHRCVSRHASPCLPLKGLSCVVSTRTQSHEHA